MRPRRWGGLLAAVLAALLMPAPVQAAAAAAADEPREPRLRYGYRGHYAQADYTYSAACSQPRYKNHCDRLMDEHARDFEREVIKALNESAGSDSGTDGSEDAMSRQRGDLQLIVSEERQLITIITLIEQSILGRHEASVPEAVNIDLHSGRLIDFAALFARPERAAMICARALEERLAHADSIAAHVLVAATEYEPRNFQITDAGLLFYLPGVLDPGQDQRTVHLEVPLSALSPACPEPRFWPGVKPACPDRRLPSGAESGGAAAPSAADGRMQEEGLEAAAVQREGQ